MEDNGSNPSANTASTAQTPTNTGCSAEEAERAASMASADSENQKCDREFEQYYKEREGWIACQLDAERSYDALLVTISTLAVGASLTKDWSDRPSPIKVFLVIGWIGFLGCLVCSLLHRYLTFYTHKKWVNVVDDEFTAWKPGAFQRALKKYDEIPFIKRVEILKIVAGCLVGIGVLSLLLLLLLGLGATVEPSQPQAPPVKSDAGSGRISQVFNFYLASGSQPSAAKVATPEMEDSSDGHESKRSTATTNPAIGPTSRTADQAAAPKAN